MSRDTRIHFKTQIGYVFPGAAGADASINGGGNFIMNLGAELAATLTIGTTLSISSEAAVAPGGAGSVLP